MLKKKKTVTAFMKMKGILEMKKKGLQSQTVKEK